MQIQAAIDDKHVVKIFDTIKIPSAKQLFIVMGFCEGGNLLEWVKRNRKHQLLNETVILQMLQEICEAVYSCHLKRIIHRDLKPENVLLDSKRRIKLGKATRDSLQFLFVVVVVVLPKVVSNDQHAWIIES